MLDIEKEKIEEFCHQEEREILRKRILDQRAKRLNKVLDLMEQGVIFLDPDTAYIDEQVTIGSGTTIGPSVIIQGNSHIGSNVTIWQNTRIVDSFIDDGTVIDQSVIAESKIGKDTNIGPFAYLRPKSVIGDKCKIGDFVEVKNSTIGDGTKASHLTYIGDADLGENINLGCGVVFVNYDGTNKHRTTVEDGCFVGCNVNLVSPVKLEQGSYIAAGTTVTEDVPSDALCVGRQKQNIKLNWAKEKGLYRK